jgi:hypothetical protein
METEETRIEVYDKRERVTTSLYAIKLSDNIFRMAENDILNCKLTFGTEFKTKINNDGKYEMVQILKESPFTTRRFFLTSQFTATEYKLLGDEIMKKGGYWQVDFGSIAIVNLPKDSDLDIDKIFKIFNFNPIEITD